MLLSELGIDTKSKEIIDQMQERGLKVSPQEVSNQKSRLRKEQCTLPVDDLPVSILKRVKELVDEFGSPDIIRKALDELEELNKRPPRG